jgi:hypothetical protein
VPDRRLEEAVRDQVRRIRGELPSSASTELRLAVVSQLADGADRLVVEAIRAEAGERGEEARLEVVLPVSKEDYPNFQEFSEDSRIEFETLFGQATSYTEPASDEVPTREDRPAAYESASRKLVARSDVVIALWDGGPTGGRGGTAETVLDAAARSKPCIWISTDGEPTVRDNLARGASVAFYREVEGRTESANEPEEELGKHPENVLKPLRDAFRRLDEFNRERLPSGAAQFFDREVGSEPPMASWVAAPFMRATLLSAQWQRRFRWASWLIFLFAMAAAAMLALSLSFAEGTTAWHWAEAGFLVLALTGLLIVRSGGFHRRWLSYRVLAERLRSAHYLAPTGVDFRRQARLEAVYVGDRPEDWLMRAFEEVWDRRPAAPKLDEGALDALKHQLADEWIGVQIQYHKEAARRHKRWSRALTAAVAVFFIATVPFAILHAYHVAEHASTFLTITLPAAGASLGALLTVNQHHALTERHARMESDLAVVQQTLLDANADTLRKASSEAARVTAQETGAWFGAMWFLDIEHP